MKLQTHIPNLNTATRTNYLNAKQQACPRLIIFFASLVIHCRDIANVKHALYAMLLITSVFYSCNNIS